MTIKNLHHLGVPCKSKIKQKNSCEILEKVRNIKISNLKLDKKVIVREELMGSILTTPGLYASFLWLDNKTTNLIKKGEFSNLELNDLYLLHEMGVFCKSIDNTSDLRYFKVDFDGLPNQVLFEVTSNCNCNCLACYHKSDINSGKEEKTSDLIKRVNILADWGLSLFEVTGGEPFLRPDLIEILEEINARERNFYVVTNGSLLKSCDSKVIDIIKKGEGIAISIDGFKETHENIRKFPGLFSDIEDGLKRLKGSGIPIYFVSTIGEHNYKDVPFLLDFASKYESILHLRPVIKTGNALENKLVSNNIHQLLLPYLVHPSAKNGFVATKKEIPESKYYGCGIRKRISINSVGNLFPCVMDRSRKFNDIKLYRQEELINCLEQETRRYLNSTSLCNNCKINEKENVCGGFCRFSTSYKNETTRKL